MKYAWYYGFEAKGIGRYVLGHRKLKRLLGASAIVRHLVETDLGKLLRALFGEPKVGPYEVLLEGAGRAVIGFASDDALQTFLEVWPLYVAERAPHLRTAQAWVPPAGDEKATREALAQALLRAQAVPPIDLPPGNPVTERSAFRKLPAAAASIPAEEKGDPAEIADAAAVEAHRESKDVDLNRDIFGAQGAASGFIFPKDLNDITGGRYIAVIHADGNGIGQRFRRCKTFKEAGELSEALKDAALKALGTALQRTLIVMRDEMKYLVGVPVLFGGDDLVMIVRADKAIEFLTAYVREFEASLESDFGHVQVTAGVAFVRANHAFHQALHLAEGLCKKTKDVSQRGISGVWFHRYTDLLEPDPPLYGCPYEIRRDPAEQTRLKAVVALAKLLADRDVARGPIRAMLTAIEDGRDSDFSDLWERFVVVHTRRMGKAWMTKLRGALEAAAVESAGERKIARDEAPTDAASRAAWRLPRELFLPDVNTLAVVQEVIDG